MRRLDVRNIRNLSTGDQGAVLDAYERDADQLIAWGIDAKAKQAGKRLLKRVEQMRAELLGQEEVVPC